MKIIDCFTFYNELEMLKYRLNVLNDSVDYFVLVEANQTFLGKPKPLYFKDNCHLFEKYREKIIHIIVDLPYLYPNIDYKNNKPFQNYDYHENGEQWINEAFQRHCITRAFDKLQIEPEDFIIVSDLDEIINPKILYTMKTSNIYFDFYKLEMDLYYYNLHNKLLEKWYHPYIMSYKYYTNIINTNMSTEDSHIRLYLSELRLYINNEGMLYIKNGGWHLSYFGDVNFIQNKYLNYAHVESGCPDASIIQHEIDNYKKKSIQDNDNLPPLYLEYLQNFIYL